jgi:hypothetical protein
MIGGWPTLTLGARPSPLGWILILSLNLPEDVLRKQAGLQSWKLRLCVINFSAVRHG